MTNSPKTYYYLAKDGTSSITGDHTWCSITPVSFVSGSYGGTTIAYIGGSPNHGELSGMRVENVKLYVLSSH